MRILVEKIEKGIAKTGNAFLKVYYAGSDKTRGMAYLWDGVDRMEGLYGAGNKIYECSFGGDSSFPKIESFEEGIGDITEFYSFLYPDDSYAENVYNSLRSSVKDGFLGALIDEVMGKEFNGGTVKDAFITIPAAKAYHHNYRYGLLRHTHEVMSFVSRISEADLFKGSLDRDVLLCGALLHDVGKVYEYSFDGVNSADYGKSAEVSQIYLGSHLYKGAEMAAVAYEKLINKSTELDTEINKLKAEHVKHIILSHHLQQEWGAVPKAPKTLEAFLVFLADYFSAAFGKHSALDWSDVSAEDLMRETSKYDSFFGFTPLLKKLVDSEQ